ncbi:MAG: hypothetical protein WC877_01785 [Dehalococcoidales bacterium]|jgi:hypothetical protein
MCKICDSPIGLEWTQKLQKGNITVAEMALKFKTTVAEVEDHNLNHEISVAVVPHVKFSEKIQDPDYLLDKVESILDRVERWLDLNVDDGDDPDPRTIDRGTKLVKEMRETIKLVYELQGKFNKGDTYHQQYIQIQGNYNQFVNNALEQMCPMCQQKVLEMMEEDE